MDLENPLHFIVYYAVPPLVLLIGTTGNVFGLISFHRMKLCKIGSKLIYKFIFVTDSLNLLNIIVMYLANGYGKDVTLLTNVSCKIVMYLNYTLAPISPLLLVFNSLLKHISINKNLENTLFWLKKKHIQFVFAIGLIVFNMIYYLPALFIIQLQTNPNSHIFFDQTPECTFIDTNKQIIMFSMDLFNRVFIPFTLLIICSFCLLRQIFKMKRDINSTLVVQTKVKGIKREIKATFTLVCLNIFYVTLNLPIVMILFTQISFESISFSVSLNLYYLAYGVNFYIIVLTNSYFKREFFRIFRKKQRRPSANSFQDEHELSIPFWV